MDEAGLPEGFTLWPPQVQQQWVESYHALYFPKLRWWQKPESDDEDSGPRPKQLPPDHPRHSLPDNRGYRCGCTHGIPNCGDCPPCPGNPGWSIWLCKTARGTGKTKAGSNWVLEMALSKPDIHVGICAPRYDDVRGVCIEGESGLLTEARRNNIEIRDYNKNLQVVTLANGSVIRGFSAEKPESIRGQNLSFVWFDELASIRYFEFYHEGLMPALRKGDNPRMLITTTPKRVRLIRDLIEESRHEFDGPDGPGTGVHLTEAIAAENIQFSRKRREWLERKYAGNPVMLAQELRGEMLGEVDGALFPLEKFNEYRVYPDKDTLPQWRRVVVALDPATTSKASSDESGIVVTAEGADGDFYVLEDCSGRYGPDQQMQVVAEAYYRHNADCVVAEVNMTGDYMRALLSTVDANIPLRTVHGMKGKVSRAQGPSSLFMQGRMHMVGDNFRQLEDQLAAMAEGDDRTRMKDDRADACLADGTPVLTPLGEVPIEDIAAGDLVWTRQGWRPVTATRCTQRDAEVGTVTLSDGRTLTGTGDHRIWTENRGWTRLDALVWADILSAWSLPHTSSIKAASTGAIRTVRNGAIGSTTSEAFLAASSTSTAMSGVTPTWARKSRTAGTSIMTTRTRSTTTRRTWSSSRPKRTPTSIPVISPGRKRTFSAILSGSGRWPLNGMALKKASRGMPSTARMLGRSVSPVSPGLARSAALSSRPCGTARGAVRVAASTGLPSSGYERRSPALSAGANTRRTARGAAKPVPLSVAGSYAVSEWRRDVYDLTVAGVHEFTAAGVIVHNCVWAMIHLAGSNQGDWASVYGFRDCSSCGARVNEDKDEVCGNCGRPVTRMAPKHAGGRPSQVPWSAAYLRTCVNEDCGKTYPPGERTCPHCSLSPESYMRRALAMSSGNTGKLGYTGGNWLAGRKF
jgi:phage terminase large subunit-like protein